MSFTFGTPITSASMEFAFGTPAGDAKSTKAESSLFGSTLAAQNTGGFNFTTPATGTALGTSADQPPSLYGTTFGGPPQSTAPTFGTGTSLFSATRAGEDPQSLVSLPFGALTTCAPLNSGPPTIQAVLPTYASSTVKASPGSGLLGTAFQSPISIFGSTGQSVTSTFAAPVQSTTMPTLGVGQSARSPVAFGAATPAAVNRFGAATPAAVPSYGIATQSAASSSFGIAQGTAAPQFSFGASPIAKPKITASTSSFTPALGFVASTTSPAQPPLSFNFGIVTAAVPTASTFPVGSNMPTNLPSAAIYTTATTNTTTAAAITAAAATSATTTSTHAVINSTAAPLDFGAGTFITTVPSAAPTIPTAVSRTAVNVAGGGSSGASITKPLVASLPAFGIGTSVSTSTVPTFPLGATTTATTSTSNALGSASLAAATTTTAPTTFSSVTPSITTSISSGFTIPDGTTTKTNTTTVSGNVVSSTIMTYGQLEDLINKWTLDLENQCKIFANQAKQLNAWDRLLISNGDKILALNTSIERVKEQQHQLDQELDFIRAQQKELEHLIVPLEKELQETPVTDTDRNHTYQLAENMDSQLKQMSEDLKEIIETLNESNRNQELSNPITQIGRILNAHMNSLQWIDVNTNKISSQLDQISKMHDLNRRNHEIVLQRTYD